MLMVHSNTLGPRFLSADLSRIRPMAARSTPAWRSTAPTTRGGSDARLRLSTSSAAASSCCRPEAIQMKAKCRIASPSFAKKNGKLRNWARQSRARNNHLHFHAQVVVPVFLEHTSFSGAFQDTPLQNPTVVVLRPLPCHGT